MFSEFSATKRVWKKLIDYFRNTIDLPKKLPQSAIFGFLIAEKEIFKARIAHLKIKIVHLI